MLAKVVAVEQLESAEIRELISHCVFPAPDRVEAACNRYRAEDTWTLFAFEQDGKTVGVLGLEMTGPGQAIIQHIAVVPQARQRGIGWAMIEQVCRAQALEQIKAETDEDAVDFYRKCGFAIKSLGEKYPGVERFLCQLSNQQQK